MSIKINKQLTRPDKGTLSAGSIIDFQTRFISDDLTVVFMLTHWFNQLAKDTAKEEGWKPVAEIKNFSYKLPRKCTEEEWLKLNDAGSADMVEGWLKDIIDSKIGDGNTEII